MSKQRTFKKEKWIFFALSVVVYFAPFITVTCCMFPFIKNAEPGYKVALGAVMVLINAIPFLMGIFRAFFAHFPMLNIFAIGICILGGIFTFNIFAEHMMRFLFIELAAAIGSVASCVLWHFHRKYARYAETVKAVKLSNKGEE